jgi:hypothetical protein
MKHSTIILNNKKVFISNKIFTAVDSDFGLIQAAIKIENLEFNFSDFPSRENKEICAFSTSGDCNHSNYDDLEDFLCLQCNENDESLLNKMCEKIVIEVDKISFTNL